MQTYEALGTRLDLENLVELRELAHARDSFRHAELFAAEIEREREREQPAAPRRRPAGRRRG